MFLTTNKAGYNKNGAQFAHGYFLLFANHNKYKQSNDPEEWKKVNESKLYARTVFVRYTQCGHFMMGQVNLVKGGKKHVLSGAFGRDGLPTDYEDYTPEEQATFVVVPDDIAEMYWQEKGNYYEVLLNYGQTLLKDKK